MTLATAENTNLHLLCANDPKQLGFACSQYQINDHLVLCEDAVNLLLDPDVLNKLSNNPHLIYVLEQDAVARGIKLQIENNADRLQLAVNFIDYPVMVELTQRSDKWLSWC
jgi:sulfur relay protein TusB/DsrH